MNKFLWIGLVSLIIVCIGGVSKAEEIHSELCNFGCPASPIGANSNDLIIRPIYILSSNDSTKLADWVAYRVTKETIGPSKDRVWRADPLLASKETLEPEDYTDAHAVIKTDRGHQVPLASFTNTPYWELTNLLSNITPQATDLNQGPWRFLEDAVRNLAKAPNVDGVYVATGPLFARAMPSLPGADEKHRVPSGYWKVISTWDGHSIHVAAFIFDQYVDRAASYCNFLVEVSDVERASKLRLFHGLDRYSRQERKTVYVPLKADIGC